MDNALLDLGVGGIFVILVLKEVFSFLGKKKEIDFRKLEADVSWLRQVHEKTDEDGVPVWYVRRSLEEAIKKLADNLSVQTEILRDLTHQVREVAKIK